MPGCTTMPGWDLLSRKTKMLFRAQDTFGTPNVRAVCERYRGRLIKHGMPAAIVAEVRSEVIRCLVDFGGADFEEANEAARHVVIARHRHEDGRFALAMDFQFDGADDPTGDWERIAE